MSKDITTVNDLIKELQSLSEEKRALPVYGFVVEAPPVEETAEGAYYVQEVDDTVTDRVDINLIHMFKIMNK